MLQAMNTGHDGSLTTIHANSPRDALARLEMLVLMAGVDLPLRAIREQIAGAFDVLIHLTRLVDGSRRISHITEVIGTESDVVTLQDMFIARTPDGGRRRRPRLLAPLEATGPQAAVPPQDGVSGVSLPAGFFHSDEDDTFPSRVLAAAPDAWRSRRGSAAESSSPRPRARSSCFPRDALAARRPEAGRRRATTRPCAASSSPARRPRRRRSCARTAARGSGLQAENLGKNRSVVLAIDRSQSMAGQAFADAIAAARAFIATKNPDDRIEVVGFGSTAVGLTGFSSSTIDADSALRSLCRRPQRGDGALRRRSASRRRRSGPEPRGRPGHHRVDRRARCSEHGLAGAGGGGRPRGAGDGVPGRHRERPVLARPAPPARRPDGRLVPRASPRAKARRDVRADRAGAQPDMAHPVRHRSAARATAFGSGGGAGPRARRPRRSACRRRNGRPLPQHGAARCCRTCPRSIVGAAAVRAADRRCSSCWPSGCCFRGHEGRVGAMRAWRRTSRRPAAAAAEGRAPALTLARRRSTA